MDVRGVELADSLRERFWREMTAESKTVNHIVNYIPDKHLHIYIPALHSSKSEFSKRFHSSPSLRSNPSGVHLHRLTNVHEDDNERNYIESREFINDTHQFWRLANLHQSH